MIPNVRKWGWIDRGEDTYFFSSLFLNLLRHNWHLIRLGCIWDRILCFPHFGSSCHGCCLEITLRLGSSPTKCHREATKLGKAGEGKQSCYESMGLVLDCLGGALVTHGSFQRGLLIKRHRCSSALSRTAAGYNTKQRDFPNCLHTCRAVEVCQLATRCLLAMYERKQLKEEGVQSKARFEISTGM